MGDAVTDQMPNNAKPVDGVRGAVDEIFGALAKETEENE